jgi:hypothetical protein
MIMASKPHLAILASFLILVGTMLTASGEEMLTDPVSRLAERLEKGDVTLEYREGEGYLPSLLQQLDVNDDSQMLVFSKTSFQQAIINPKNPRAVYFNDTVSVGTVPGGDVYELLALEPKHGMVFYSLSARQTERPHLQRRGIECLFCHAMGNKGAPSLVVASVIPDAEGTPAYTSTFISTIDHRTPLDQRWGGWYVTGTHGSVRHMGNAVTVDPFKPLSLQQEGTQNLTTLEDKIDVSKYLAGTSDIVALMTLEHQVGVANRINATTYQYQRIKGDGMSAADWDLIDGEIDDLVGYMLFVDEAPLEQPVKGVSSFTRTFSARGPRDSAGRSLRDFDLRTRLFQHRLSYMIYSDFFDAMPQPVLDRVYRRLFDVLSANDVSPKYRGVTNAERAEALEILLETKPSLPDYWTDSR